MSSHEESHSNNFHRHFPCVDNKENEINSFDVVCNSINFLIQGKETTINHNDRQNEAIKPW